MSINPDNQKESLAPQAEVPVSKNVPSNIMIGLDVGSTTVKAVVMDPDTDEILWKDYKRHETRQPEMVFQFLKDITDAFPLP